MDLRKLFSPTDSSSNPFRSNRVMRFPSDFINFSFSILAKIRERVSGIVPKRLANWFFETSKSNSMAPFFCSLRSRR